MTEGTRGTGTGTIRGSSRRPPASGVPDVARRGGRSTGARLPGRIDAARATTCACVDDLHAWLREQGDWVPLGAADEQKPAPDGTVEAWGRSADNPVGGWYGLRKGYRGRFGMYLPPLLEALGLAELEHKPQNNRVRAR